jgi:hypothetical protein
MNYDAITHHSFQSYHCYVVKLNFVHGFSGLCNANVNYASLKYFTVFLVDLQIHGDRT